MAVTGGASDLPRRGDGATQGEYLMTRHDVLFIVLGEAPSKGTCHPGYCVSPSAWTVDSLRPDVTERAG